MTLTNSIVLLTGIGREGQVGEVVARRFSAAGASLLLVDRRQEQAAARAADVSRDGRRATAYGCDLADAADVSQLAEHIRAEHGGQLQALVHLAGGFAMSGPIADSDVDVWHRMISINLTTAYLVTRAFLPFVRAASGSIVYFASEAALPGGRVAEMAAYAAAKSGLVTFMRAVAQEERKHGVRANAVAPTSIRTAANVHAMGDNARYVEREEVAAAVAYLCGDDASAVTGQVIGLS